MELDMLTKILEAAKSKTGKQRCGCEERMMIKVKVRFKLSQIEAARFGCEERMMIKVNATISSLKLEAASKI